jgi:hypothetical protein
MLVTSYNYSMYSARYIIHASSRSILNRIGIASLALELIKQLDLPGLRCDSEQAIHVVLFPGDKFIYRILLGFFNELHSPESPKLTTEGLLIPNLKTQDEPFINPTSLGLFY